MEALSSSPRASAHDWNIPSTCNAGGAKNWRAEHSAYLRGAEVVILPDYDPAGQSHLDRCAASLKEAGANVRVLDLPGLDAKGDVVDWRDAGGTAERLHDLIAHEARPWAPPNGGGHYPQRPSRGIEDDNDGKPVIKIKAGDLPCLVDATEDAVLGADRGLYKRGGQIVRVGDIELLGADEKKTTALAILDQSEHALLEDASASAHFLRFHKRENKWLPADPPMNVIRAWQARASRLRLPLLSGVISSPLILPTGRIIDKHGYDPRTGFFFDPLGTSFSQVPAKPTQDDARQALEIFHGVIAEFPFVDEASKSVALSGILTSVARRALDFAFMHAVTAPAFGSGKSYLVDLFCMIATGRAAPVVTQGRSPEEFDKQLDARLLKGVGHIAIDNVSRPLEGERLCQILTQPYLDIRPLGISGNTTVRPDVFVTATGTNMTIVEDLRRRSLLCSLDSKAERPELRKFSNDPLKLIQQDRGKYVVAALTIIRAFMHSGEKQQAESINGYARYCTMIREPLIWLGCADPCETMETIRKQDTRLAARKQIARQWKAVIGNEPKTARQVINEANRRDGSYDSNELVNPDFHAALSEIAKGGKPLTTAALGYWLRGIKDDRFSFSEPVPTNPAETRLVPHWFEATGDEEREGTYWRLKWP
jgi:putative DNA primase/helicase